MSKTTTPMTKPQREMLLAAAAREDGTVPAHQQRARVIDSLVSMGLGERKFWGCAKFVINAEGRAVAAGLEA